MKISLIIIIALSAVIWSFCAQSGSPNLSDVHVADTGKYRTIPWAHLFADPDKFEKQKISISGFLGYLEEEGIVVVCQSEGELNKKSAEPNFIRVSGRCAENYVNFVNAKKYDYIEGEYVRVVGVLEVRKWPSGNLFTLRLNAADVQFDELMEKNAQVVEIMKKGD